MQNETIQKTFTMDEMISLVEKWLVSGDLNSNMLSDNFQFSSPFWKAANKAEFIAQFGDPKSYKEVALSKINHFDPIIQLKNSDKYFAIILQYHTKNGSHVYETVLGAMEDGLLVELRSIYDIDETKQALEIQ